MRRHGIRDALALDAKLTHQGSGRSRELARAPQRNNPNSGCEVHARLTRFTRLRRAAAKDPELGADSPLGRDPGVQGHPDDCLVHASRPAPRSGAGVNTRCEHRRSRACAPSALLGPGARSVQSAANRSARSRIHSRGRSSQLASDAMHASANNAPRAQPPAGNTMTAARSPAATGSPVPRSRRRSKQREPHCELPPAVSPGGRGSPPRLPPRMPLRERPPALPRDARRVPPQTPRKPRSRDGEGLRRPFRPSP